MNSPKSIRNRFYLAAAFMFAVFIAFAFGLIMAFKSLEEQGRNIETATTIDREAQALQMAFWELRFQEKSLLSANNPGVARQFSTGMIDIKRRITAVLRTGAAESYADKLSVLHADIEEYDASFARLVAAKNSQKMTLADMDASLQILTSSALFHNANKSFRLLFALHRLHEAYLISRTQVRFQALQIGIDSVKATLGDFNDDDIAHLFAESNKFSASLERDYELEKDIRTIAMRFEGISEEVLRILSEISRGAVASFRTAQSEAEDVRGKLTMLVPVCVLGTVVLLYLVLAYLSRAIIYPVQRLSEVVSKVRDGDLSARVDMEGQGEFKELAVGVDLMLNTIEDNNEKLSAYRDNLEQLIELRTKEYAQAVKDLQKEIARRQVSETQMLAEKKKAEDASRLKTEFLANMSHEIRTPMNGIVGMVQILEQDELPPRHKEHLKVIQSSAASLLLVINDVLDLSKIEAGRMILAPKPFDPRQFFQTICDLYEPVALQQGVVFAKQLDDSMRNQLVADEIRLQQIVTNLLSNAFKFTQKGQVEFQMRLDRQAPQLMLEVRVSDTGVGIAKEKQTEVFEPFVQANGGINRLHGGTGLGLAISTRLVALLGGDGIDVDSDPGRGASFRFRIPVTESVVELDALATKQESQHMTPGGQSLSGLRVLVAEDSETNQYIIKMALESMGVSSLVVVANGKLAVEQLEQAPDAFDVVLMDLQMPVLDGLAATRRLRELGHHLPVVALTAHAMDSDKQKCQEAGMNFYISKPFQLDEVRSVLENLLKEKAASGQGDLHDG